MIIAGELGSAIRVTSGPALERAGDLAAMLSNSSRAMCCSSTRSTASHVPPRRCCTWRWRTSASTSSWAGLRATSILPTSPFTLVGATTRLVFLTGRCATVRVHRPYGVLRGRRARRGVDLIGRSRHRAARRCRGRGRRPIPWHTAYRQPVASDACRDYAEVRGDGEVTLPIARAALAVYDVDERASTGSTGGAVGARLWLRRRAGRRRRWRWQSARSRRRWKRSANPSWCAGSSRAPRADASPPRLRGTTSAWCHSPDAASSATWGVRGPGGEPNLFDELTDTSGRLVDMEILIPGCWSAMGAMLSGGHAQAVKKQMAQIQRCRPPSPPARGIQLMSGLFGTVIDANDEYVDVEIHRVSWAVDPACGVPGSSTRGRGTDLRGCPGGRRRRR